MSLLPSEDAAARLAAIVDSSDDAIIGLDLSGRITSWNPAARQLFGYESDDAIGQSIRLIIPEDQRAAADDVLRRVARGEVVQHFETVRRRRDGVLVPISLTVSPIRTVTGEISGASKIARDISGRDRAERAARRLAAIVESSDDAIISKDLNGVVTSWNGAACRMFGYSAPEIIGRSIRILIPADRQAEEDDVLALVRSGDKVDHFETIRRRKDGTLVPISLTVSPIRDGHGVVIGASKIARDISDRVRADADRARLLEGAQEVSRLKDEFLATLSHELRTPLNAILGYARMIRSGLIIGEKQVRAVETIERNATSLTQIVEDVLDVSRIISGKIRIGVLPVDLPTVIREALEGVMPAADAKGIRIETLLDANAPPISGDPERLQQVLWNLLSNAVKFTGRGGTVQVRLERTATHVDIVVSDTGIGISPEFLPHVFERFRQADAGTTRERGGLGLGLAIARHLIEMHGGTIEASSGGAGHGATLRVTLPVMAAHPDERPESRFHPSRSSDGPRSPVPDLGGLRVVAVDDDRDALGLVREILEAAGAEVFTAESAPDVLNLLDTARPDVLVADLGMPRMDGFELIGRIRQLPDPALRDMPAAALTAYARSEDRARALRSGFQMHLSKPIDPAELMAAIASLAKRVGPTRA